eukprot:IDg16872t1
MDSEGRLEGAVKFRLRVIRYRYGIAPCVSCDGTLLWNTPLRHRVIVPLRHRACDGVETPIDGKAAL